MTLALQSQERRRFGRKETNVSAQAVIPGRSGVRCIIKNVSVVGALLAFEKPFAARGAFRLYADNGTLDAQCVIRREDGNDRGVEFIAVAVNKLAAAPMPSSSAAPELDLSHKLELTPSRGSDLRARLFGARSARPSEPALPPEQIEPLADVEARDRGDDVPGPGAVLGVG